MKSLDVEVTDIADPNKPESLPQERDAAMLAKQDVLFCSYPPINHLAMKNLKLVQITSAGYSQLFGMDLPARNVHACNGSGVFDSAIAEWNVAMLVNMRRDLRGMIRNQEKGAWIRKDAYETEIRGSVVGFWGYGGLARQTARLCKSMGLTVHVLTRDGVKALPNRYVVPGTGDAEGVLPDKVFTNDERMDFLSGLDFLVMAMPLNPRTEGICGEAELRALKPHAIVLNPARGPLIKEQALLEALREKRIAGAALDTHYHYPMPEDHPLWQFENVIMTPHISGSAAGPFYLPRIWDIFVSNVERLMKAETLVNELTATQLAG